MKILKEHLLPAVQFLNQIAGKRGLPTLCMFRLEASGNVLSIRATDLDQEAASTVPCNGELPPLLVNAHHLSELAKTASDSLSATMAGESLEVESGWEASLPTLKAEEFPPSMFSKGIAQGVSASDLADAMESVEWARCLDKERYVLSGIHVVLSAKSIVCESTDGKMMGLAHKPSIAGKCDFVIPAANAGNFITSLRREGANLLIAENCACVRYEGGEYATKLVEGGYPSTSLIVKAERKEIGELNIAGAIAHTGTCLSLCNDEWLNVVLAFSRSGCELSAQDKHAPTKYTGTVSGKFKTLTFKTDARRLLSCLKSLNGNETVKVFENESQQLVFGDNGYNVFLSAVSK